MKAYRHIFLDLDDTLLDFGAAEKEALPKVFMEFGFTLTDEVRATYKKVNGALWQALEEGTVTREELMATRFAKTFAHYGLEIDGVKADARFRELLAECKVFVPGAYEVVEQLSQNYHLYIASNGISSTQQIRLERTKLKPFFKEIIVSEDTGSQKPQPAFFDYAFRKVTDFKKEEALMVGDSYSADIVGGARAGIDTCWLNPQKKVLAGDVKPTYEIEKLQQLVAILENN